MHTLILICVSLLALLVFVLGFTVSMARRKAGEGVAVHDDPTSPLLKAVRAHANSTEYIGAIAALFLVTGIVYQGRDLGLLASGLIILLTAARFLHAFGMLTCKTLNAASPFRFVGALFTYLFGIGLALLLLVRLIF